MSSKVAAARSHGFAQILRVIGPDRKRIDPDCPERQRRDAEWLERRSSYASGVVTIPELLLPTAATEDERAYLMRRHEADLSARAEQIVEDDKADRVIAYWHGE